MVLLPVAGLGPGHEVPAADDVHHGGEAGGHADAEAEGQQVVVTPESEAENVSGTIQPPGDQIESLKSNVYSE